MSLKTRPYLDHGFLELDNITARRMISGDVLKYRNGLSLVILKGYFVTLPASIRFPLTEPCHRLAYAEP